MYFQSDKYQKLLTPFYKLYVTKAHMQPYETQTEAQKI